MMTITHDDIEKALDYFENKQFSDKTEKEFISRFPSILQYLTSNQFNTLSQDEYFILMFCAIVLMKAITGKYGIEKAPGSELIENLETVNWQKAEENPAKSFATLVMNMMGEENKDVAQLIISSLDDDNGVEDKVDISLPAKKIIFITIKTIFDALQHSLQNQRGQ